MRSSAVPHFFGLSIEERRNVLRHFLGLSEGEASVLKDLTTLGLGKLAAIGENPISNFELPLRVADGFRINGVDYFVPLVVEEASVVAGVCYGAKLCYEDGGIHSYVMKGGEYGKAVGQVQLINVENPMEVEGLILDGKNVMLEKANQDHRFSRAYDLRVRRFEDGMGIMLIIDVFVDPGDAMGAAVASDIAEAIAGEVSEMTGCRYNACIVSNFSGRHVQAKVKVPTENLARKSIKGEAWSGEEVKDGVVWLSKWAEEDVARAVTHNKGIMNGVDGVAVATGQDWRAIESANHAFALRNGQYMPLTRWRSEDNFLLGELEMLIPCGVVGGEIKSFPKAEFVLKKILRVKSADELAKIMGAVGLAQNLAALSMLATIGLKEGHQPHRKTI